MPTPSSLGGRSRSRGREPWTLVPARKSRSRGPGRGIGEGRHALAIDPVCGMTIETEAAVAHAEYEGTTYYFCSRACYEAFVADQGLYATGSDTDLLDRSELARRGSTSAERVTRLMELGIVSPGDGGFTQEDVMRV